MRRFPHIYMWYIYIYHTHIVFPPQLYNVCIPHSVFDQMYSIIEGKNQRFSSPIQSWKSSYYCPGFQSISCVYVHAWKTEVRDGVLACQSFPWLAPFYFLPGLHTNISPCFLHTVTNVLDFLTSPIGSCWISFCQTISCHSKGIFQTWNGSPCH